MEYQITSIRSSVFRAYDIRGLIGEELDENAFYSIGKALSLRLQALGRSCAFVARDGRLSSESLQKALSQGLIDSGIHVLDLGEVATPVMYYATEVAAETDSGFMVTGSHNPTQYNGLKMVIAGKTLAQEDISALHESILANSFVEAEGSYQAFPLLESYMQRIVADIQLQRSLKVVVDCGNGVAGPYVVKVLAALGCEVIPLYCEVDGTFPNHHPDPSVEENLADLKARVLEEKADLGLAFDGDADRLGVITEKAEIIWPDRLLMLYALNLLQTHPGTTIVYDVKCSSHLAGLISAAGGYPLMCPTGHSIVKAVMKEKNALLAGEMSGHLFFKERWYGFDDALYSACRLLELLSQDDRPLSAHFLEIPESVHTPEIKIPIEEDKKFPFMARFIESAQFPSSKKVTIDGLRIEYPHGWGLLRASNTTPALIARFEAQDRQSLLDIQALFRIELEKLDEDLVLSF